MIQLTADHQRNWRIHGNLGCQHHLDCQLDNDWDSISYPGKSRRAQAPQSWQHFVQHSPQLRDLIHLQPRQVLRPVLLLRVILL